jgi:hypothetical protein
MRGILDTVLSKPLNKLRLIGADKMSDEKYLKLIFNMGMGRELRLDKPVYFNDKLQWFKLNDRQEHYTDLADKYKLREYALSRLGEDIMPPLLGVYNSFDEVNLDKLLHRYVLKCNHGHGAYVTCRDTYNFNRDEAEKLINKYISTNYYHFGREYPQKNIQPKLLVESYIDDPEKLYADDLYVLCFNGKAKYIRTDTQKTNMTMSTDWFDTNWKHIAVSQQYKYASTVPTAPKKLDTLLNYAERLAKGLRFVRVDFFIVQDRIYFSELTFYPDSGLGKFDNITFDKELGDMFVL